MLMLKIPVYLLNLDKMFSLQFPSRLIFFFGKNWRIRSAYNPRIYEESHRSWVAKEKSLICGCHFKTSKILAPKIGKPLRTFLKIKKH